jgi:hypothetical protein
MAKKTQPKTDQELEAEIRELQDELDRRTEQRKQIKEARRSELLEKQCNLLTRELIDAFVPEHERTSCNDSDPNNGWNGNSGYDCIRCALLESISAPWAVSSPYIFKLDAKRYE